MREKTLFTFYFIFSQYILISFAQQISLQVPLVSNNNKECQQDVFDFSPIHTPPQRMQTKTKTFKLKHVLHHGVTPSTNQLFRQLNINDIEKDQYHTTFNEHVINSVFIDNSRGNEDRYHIREIPDLPDPKDKNTVLSMAKMSYDAYIELEPLNDHWIDLGDLDKLPFGWEDDGIRGYVFADSDNKTVVIAIKGTTLSYLPNGGGPVARNDKLNDNLMFSCCCAKVDITWRGVCGCYKSGWNCDNTCLYTETRIEDSYYAKALKIFERVKNDYQNSDIWLTGHSLGGSLASLLALRYNKTAFAYQSPGELLYAKRLGLNTTHSHRLPIYHFGHTADPISMGVCNGRTSLCYHWGFALETKCHIGSSCVYDTKSKLGWKSNIRNHGIVPFMEKVIDKWDDITNGKEDVANCIKEENCKDCQRWNFI